MKTFAWISKYVILPSFPFLLGTVVRILHSGEVRMEWLSAAELSFSMTMLSLVLSVNASRLQNVALRDALVTTCHMGAILALLIFSCAIFIETDIQSSINSVWRAAQTTQAGDNVLSPEDFKQVERFRSILSRLRMASIILSLITISFAFSANKKYGLEDL